MALSFCKACGVKVEWHPTINGKQMPIDPDPHPEGRFAFGPGLKLMGAPVGTKPRMYRCHLDTCPKKELLKPAVVSVCDKEDCPFEGFHFHCFECGEVGHYKGDCPGSSE